MMKLSSRWSGNCKLSVDTTLSLKSKQCSKTWLNPNKWCRISKQDQETQEILLEESKLMLKSLPVDIGHSKKYQSAQFHLNLSKFRMFSTNSTKISSQIDRSIIFSPTAPSWFNLLSLRNLSCLTYLSTSVPYAVCSTIMKSWHMDRFKLILD